MNKELNQEAKNPTPKSRANKELDNMHRNEALTTELHFRVLQQYAWLSSAIIGASVFLVQLNEISFNAAIYPA